MTIGEMRTNILLNEFNIIVDNHVELTISSKIETQKIFIPSPVPKLGILSSGVPAQQVKHKHTGK